MTFDRKRLTLAAGAAALVAVAVAAMLWARSPDWRVLFSNLSDRDGGAVLSALTQMGVPYRHADGGGAILVPAAQVHDARLRLASQGLPRGGSVGFELLENQKFGVTQFQERLNFQRGLEGELARSIQSLAAVQGARVHLALPAQPGFFREQQKPSASVVLALHPGRTLDRAQLAGIVHLVASSVPELSPKQVAVIDQTGALLSDTDGSGAPLAGLDDTQRRQVRALEAEQARRIVELLEPMVGPGNVRAQVAVDLDWSQTESVAEQFRPNQGDASVRSTATSESRDGAGTGGVPGALSNQPPAPASAPVAGPGQSLPPASDGAKIAAGAAPAGAPSRRDATTNYEVDRTVRVTRGAAGGVRRITAAVVVAHRRVVGADGKVTHEPLPPKQLEEMQAAVREAIGFDKARGDSVNFVHAPFTEPDVPAPIDTPLWKDPEAISLARGIAGQAGLLALGLAVILMVIRPALRDARGKRAAGAEANAQVTPLPAEGRIDATVAGDAALPSPVRAAMVPGGAVTVSPELLKIARDNPATVANVVRAWVGTGG